MSHAASFNSEIVLNAWKAVASTTQIRALRAALAVLLCEAHGLTLAEIARLLGIARSTVEVMHLEARQGQRPPTTPHGGRRRGMMSVTAEDDFCAPWEAQATKAGFDNLRPMRDALQQALGRQVCASQFYRLLARRGWFRAGPANRWICARKMTV